MHFMLSDLFGALEGKNGDGTPYSEQLGIITYGVSMTTLEDVFLKLGRYLSSYYFESLLFEIRKI